MKKKLMNLIIMISILSISIQADVNDNIEIGAEYNHWKPVSLDAIDVTTTGYNVAFIELNLKVRDKINSVPILPDIQKLRYETNFNNTHQNEIIIEQAKKNNYEKYEYLLGVFDFKSFIIKYEKEVFIADVIANNDLIYKTKDFSQNLSKGNSLNFLTKFESYGIGRTKKYGKTIYAGLFYGKYKKPYFVKHANTQDTTTLYYASFDYYGIEASSIDDFIPWVLKYGFGKIQLADNYLNDQIGDSRISFLEVGLSPHYKRKFNNKIIKFQLSANYKKFYSSPQGGGESETIFGNSGFNSDFTLKASVSIKFNLQKNV